MYRPRTAALIACLAAATALAATVATAGADAASTDRPTSTGPALTITTAANPRPELISGTSTLIRVTTPDTARTRHPRITENGHDITGAFSRQPDGTWLGLATDLRPGIDTLQVSADGQRVAVRVTDHPITGPVFSGPQQHPYFCETTAFGLAPAAQPDCSAPTTVTYWYQNTAGTLKPLADPAQRPADLADTSVNGRTVPYVVRLETGTIDRAVYQTAALSDGHAPSPLHPDTAWNGKLVYTFGGGCNGGYHQGNTTGGVLNPLMLSQGYAVASSTLNVLDQNCSTMLSAEAAMMVKEHFIDTYGPVAHTIGWGGSGGAIQQYDIADAYPGILDGIITGVSFPDPLSVMAPAADCRLLDTFFAGPGKSFTPAQRQAVAGFGNYDSCLSWDQFFANRLTPTGSCNHQLISTDNAIPAAAMWNPATNPGGVKCSVPQQLANQFGTDPATGLVPGTLDNTGVQYGLQALNNGQITAGQFITLNQDIGGLDATGDPAPQRTAADTQALTTAYREDILPSGSQGLRTTPIIDQRVYLDQAGTLNDIHTAQWSYAMRARLQQANDTSANQVIIENQPTPDQTAAASVYELHAMDQWLTAIAAEPGHTTARSVIAAKPAGLADGCYLSATDRITSPLTDPATGPCAALYPVGSDPRLVAGEPLASDILKCQLRPIDFADYRATFTTAQKSQLRAAFPDGVCNYQLPGVGQIKPTATWLGYGDGTTGTFGHAPAPRPLDGPPHNS